MVLHAALRDHRFIDVGEEVDRENLGLERDPMHDGVVLFCADDARDRMAVRFAVHRRAGLRLIERDRLRVRADARRVVVDLVRRAELEIEIHDADDHARAGIAERIGLGRMHRVQRTHATVFRGAEAVGGGRGRRRRWRRGQRPRRLNLRHAAATTAAAAEQQGGDRDSAKRRF